ncbi:MULTISPECIES: DUF3429 domain-containing protein [Thalassolituus]|uniref:DUF3429 domain-containing protein n=1 Tax=Thalassolituus TaxID=187492 RepID=UPI000C6BAE09|nr:MULTISPECIES: DUF3429 domain-containing protein [Thalassolituus]MAX86486.1 hypothetical protein [Oceanospirillaceae bacterium]MEC8908732.1 DUF3429 domain-containing protein [Pseudomonadota bacterium]MEC9254806.1 DUF3429 domain-containing protein [Pseudomonadota bacterium]MEC9409887.1 DUF3429 domain-containing protein [Pseudomonadota bacterium]MEE3160701.1 DUF3429 domain-containing protein [Pseudomonadota bacterium]|tara:strand:+ start:2537 stop:2953 length:417 start_codon:yes stop_codon:yes gene_type:complete
MNGISQKLGYAGLIPFVFFALSVLAGSTWAPDFFTLYSALILSFMAGACWGVMQAQRDHVSSAELGLSIGVFLWGWLMYFVPHLAGLPGLLLGYWVLVWLERQPVFRQSYKRDYRTMRWTLTLVVSACHAVAFWGLLT